MQVALHAAGPGALLVCAALVGLGAAPGDASAQGLRSMDDSPLATFTVEDIDMMKGAINRALESGEKTEWKNEQTGSSGTAAASAGSREDCRMVAVENRHEAKYGTSKFQFCKVEGAWRVVSDPR
jgi:hypothetical protein